MHIIVISLDHIYDRLICFHILLTYIYIYMIWYMFHDLHCFLLKIHMSCLSWF